MEVGGAKQAAVLPGSPKYLRFFGSYDIFRSNLISPKIICNILKKKTATWPESFGYLVLLPTADWRGRLADMSLGTISVGKWVTYKFYSKVK